MVPSLLDPFTTRLKFQIGIENKELKYLTRFHSYFETEFRHDE